MNEIDKNAPQGDTDNQPSPGPGAPVAGERLVAGDDVIAGDANEVEPC